MSKLATPPINVAIGRRLTAIRTTAGLSQGAFADTLGLSLRAYANYERGEREMPVALFRALYTVHGINPVWLLDGPGEQPVMAATRTVDVALVERIIDWVDTELAAMGKKLRPEMRLRILKSAYTLSAERGRMETAPMRELLSIVSSR